MYDDKYTAVINGDYTGRLPDGADEWINIIYINEDYPEYKIYSAIDIADYIRGQLAELGPEYFSPDKQIAAVSYMDFTYERSGFLFCYFDGGKPDYFASFGHYPKMPVWLIERQVCVYTIIGLGIFNMTGGVRDNRDALIYIEDVNFTGLRVGEYAQGDGKLTITGGDIIIYYSGEETPARLEENERLILQFRFSGRGLSVEYSIVGY